MMTEIIPKEKRLNELLTFGFPKAFLESIGNIPELQYRVEDVEGAYFYLPTILNYKILQGKCIIPIYSCGESFYVLLYDDKFEKIIHFELENDQVYTDYGNNWELIFMDIMIQYFDDHIDDEMDSKQFISLGNKIGFRKSEDLFRLRNISIDDYNSKSRNAGDWSIEIAKELKIL